MENAYDGVERRKYMRILKNFNMVFYIKDASYTKKDLTFIKDISKGGLRFLTSHSIKEGMLLVFEISTPYTAPDKLKLEGTVVSSKEITAGILYVIRAQFNSINDQAMQVLDLIQKQKS